jgi:predicted RNase H-like HicB family nuclease
VTKEHEDAYGRYSMTIEWEPQGGVFVVTVPELPGCRTHGKTYEEAVTQAQEVIELWIDVAREDGDPIPPPRTFDLGPDEPEEADAPVPAAAGATGA